MLTADQLKTIHAMKVAGWTILSVSKSFDDGSVQIAGTLDYYREQDDAQIIIDTCGNATASFRN